MKANIIKAGTFFKYCGVRCHKKDIKNFWSFACPCGVTDTFPLNGLPTKTTPHSCGDPKHFAVEVRENDD